MTGVKRWPFLASCVMLTQADVPDLHQMIENAQPISFRVFARKADWTETADALGYNRIRMNGGRIHALKNEPHVRFHRSTFRGRPCVYFVHSRIEYIFAAPETDGR